MSSKSNRQKGTGAQCHLVEPIASLSHDLLSSSGSGLLGFISVLLGVGRILGSFLSLTSCLALSFGDIESLTLLSKLSGLLESDHQRRRRLAVDLGDRAVAPRDHAVGDPDHLGVAVLAFATQVHLLELVLTKQLFEQVDIVGVLALAHQNLVRSGRLTLDLLRTRGGRAAALLLIYLLRAGLLVSSEVSDFWLGLRVLVGHSGDGEFKFITLSN